MWKTREALYDAIERYAGDLIKKEGYIDLGALGIGNQYGSMTAMKSLLAGEKCKEAFSCRELLIISALSNKLSSLCDEVEARDDFIEKMLLGIKSNDVRYRPPKEAEIRNTVKQAPFADGNNSDQDKDAVIREYRQELERLQRELRLSKQETAHFRQEFEKKKDELAIEHAVSETMKEEQEELVTLRSYVYSLKEMSMVYNIPVPFEWSEPKE